MSIPPPSSTSSTTRPPFAPRHPVTTIRHGEPFIDDFTWLRDKSNPDTLAYLERENTWARTQLNPLKPVAEQLYAEMLGRIKETDLSVPIDLNGYWYYSRTEAGLQYPIHCRRARSMANEPEQVLLDLNELAAGRTFMAVGDFSVTDAGDLLAYSVDETGFRQYTLQLKNLTTGEVYDFRRERVTSVAWTIDGRELLYTVEHATTKRSHQLWHHRLGDPIDRLEYEEDDEAFALHVRRTRSRQWLVAQSASHTTSETRVVAATSGSRSNDWRVVLPRHPDIEYDIDHRGGEFYVRINDTGRNFRLVTAPVDDTRPERFREVVPHRAGVMLEGHACFAGQLVVVEREHGVPEIAVHRFAGPDRTTCSGSHRITFPEPVREAELHANPEYDAHTVRLSYQSLVTPASVYAYDVETRTRELLKQQEVLGGYDASAYVSERHEARATDGTMVPISLVRRRDTPTDGSAACLLEGYGSYGYSYPVSFSSNRLSLLDRGVVVAIAHIRGGGELGKAWHDQGRMGHKMNTFTDFIACAEHLVGENVASPDRIVIEGGSAGGLLMGAVVNLRPGLFRAVLSHVPFVDVLNTMSDPALPLTVGEYDEWGNPAIAEEFRWMRAYCPYTNLAPAHYPAMLIRTSLNDSQVMYWEPAKYVAKLRGLAADDRPLLLLTDMGAGHGGASGRYDHLRDTAMDYAFMIAEVGGAEARPARG